MVNFQICPSPAFCPVSPPIWEGLFLAFTGVPALLTFPSPPSRTWNLCPALWRPVINTCLYCPSFSNNLLHLRIHTTGLQPDSIPNSADIVLLPARIPCPFIFRIFNFGFIVVNLQLFLSQSIYLDNIVLPTYRWSVNVSRCCGLIDPAVCNSIVIPIFIEGSRTPFTQILLPIRPEHNSSFRTFTTKMVLEGSLPQFDISIRHFIAGHSLQGILLFCIYRSSQHSLIVLSLLTLFINYDSGFDAAFSLPVSPTKIFKMTQPYR